MKSAAEVTSRMSTSMSGFRSSGCSWILPAPDAGPRAACVPAAARRFGRGSDDHGGGGIEGWIVPARGRTWEAGRIAPAAPRNTTGHTGADISSKRAANADRETPAARASDSAASYATRRTAAGRRSIVLPSV